MDEKARQIIQQQKNALLISLGSAVQNTASENWDFLIERIEEINQKAQSLQRFVDSSRK